MTCYLYKSNCDFSSTGRKAYIDCQRGVKCFHCERIFDEKRHFDAHRCATVYRHGCAVCGKRFTTSTLLKRHLVVHTDDKPFACDLCGKTFNIMSNMKRHKLTHV